MRDDTQLTLHVEGETDLVLVRALDAPRALVFDAFTRPELVRRWLLGPDGWTMPVCEIDLRPGGRYRYLWRRERDGAEMGMGGDFREVAPPERLVHTEAFDEPWYPGESLITTLFTERDGVTTVRQTMRLVARAARDAVLASGMASGVARSYERLDRILAGRG
jgi:uncharacterized protein YndB with AHSA1/START domain